jgi:hypothetical protein
MKISKDKWVGEETYRVRIGRLWFGENYKTKAFFIIWNGFVSWQICSWRPRFAFWKQRKIRNK